LHGKITVFTLIAGEAVCPRDGMLVVAQKEMVEKIMLLSS